MSCEEQRKAYEISTIPESRRALRDPLTSVEKIDFKKPHNPLLFILRGTDHIKPATLNYRNYECYRKNGSITDYKEFKRHNHYALDFA